MTFAWNHTPAVLLRLCVSVATLLNLAACTDENKLIDTNSKLLFNLEWEKPVEIGPNGAIEVEWRLRGSGDHFLRGKKISVGVAIVPNFYPKPSSKGPRLFEKLKPVLDQASYFYRTEPKELSQDAEGRDLLTDTHLLTPDIFEQAKAANGTDFNNRTAIVLIWYVVDEAGNATDFGKRSINLKSVVYNHGRRARKSTAKGLGSMKLVKGLMKRPLLSTDIEEEYKDFVISYQHHGDTNWLVLGEKFILTAYQ